METLSPTIGQAQDNQVPARKHKWRDRESANWWLETDLSGFHFWFKRILNTIPEGVRVAFGANGLLDLATIAGHAQDEYTMRQLQLCTDTSNHLPAAELKPRDLEAEAQAKMKRRASVQLYRESTNSLSSFYDSRVSKPLLLLCYMLCFTRVQPPPAGGWPPPQCKTTSMQLRI